MVLDRTGNDVRIPLLVRYVYCKSAADTFQRGRYVLKVVNVQDTTCLLHESAIYSTRSLNGKGRRIRVPSEIWQRWGSIGCQWTMGLRVRRM